MSKNPEFTVVATKPAKTVRPAAYSPFAECGEGAAPWVKELVAKSRVAEFLALLRQVPEDQFPQLMQAMLTVRTERIAAAR